LYLERPDAIRCSQLAIDEGALRQEELLSPDAAHSAHGARLEREVRPVDEGQAAHELQVLDEKCSPGEPQAEVQSVDELQAANELSYSQSCELQRLYSRLPYSQSCELQRLYSQPLYSQSCELQRLYSQPLYSQSCELQRLYSRVPCKVLPPAWPRPPHDR